MSNNNRNSRPYQNYNHNNYHNRHPSYHPQQGAYPQYPNYPPQNHQPHYNPQAKQLPQKNTPNGMPYGQPYPNNYYQNYPPYQYNYQHYPQPFNYQGYPMPQFGQYMPPQNASLPNSGNQPYNSYKRTQVNNKNSDNKPLDNVKKQNESQQISPTKREQKRHMPDQQSKEFYQYNRRKHQQRETPHKAESGHSDVENHYQYSEGESWEESQEEEQFYAKRKTIAKKKNPVLDSKQEIRKWIEARKKNYPKRDIRPEQTRSKVQQSEMSILQKKIRKKIVLINSDPKSMMKKLKDIDILRRFILYSRKNKRPQHPDYYRSNNQNNTIENERVNVQSAVIQQQEQAAIADENIPSQKQLMMQKVEITERQQQVNDGKVESEAEAIEVPIQAEKPAKIVELDYVQRRRQDLSVDVIIKHLQMKQQEDVKTLQNLMDYKSNSFHYRYQHQTLETNLLLENIFSETSYVLQTIRYIIKNNFFEQAKQS